MGREGRGGKGKEGVARDDGEGRGGEGSSGEGREELEGEGKGRGEGGKGKGRAGGVFRQITIYDYTPGTRGYS